jgi:hypothetical protein
MQPHKIKKLIEIELFCVYVSVCSILNRAESYQYSLKMTYFISNGQI